MGYWGNRKPPLGTLLDPSHPLSQGLVADYLIAEGGGVNLYDSVRPNGTLLALTFGGNPNSKWISNGFTIPAGTGNQYAKITTPSYLKLPWPITLIWQGSIIDTSTSDRLFGCSYSNIQTAPYHSYAITGGANADIGIGCNLGGTNTYFTTIDSFYAGRITAGPVYQIAARWAPSGFTNSVTLFVNGSLFATMNPTLSNPTFNSDSQFGFGEIDNASNGQSNSINYFGRVYNRALSDSEIEQSYIEPYSHYLGPRRPKSIFTLTVGAAPTSSPHNLGMDGGFVDSRGGFA